MLDQKIQNQNKPPETQSGDQGINTNPPPIEQSMGIRTSVDSQPTGAEQNVSNIYPRISIERIQNPSRFYAIPILGILVKTISLLPVFLYLGILGIGLSIGAIINPFVVLFTGRYWKAAYQFNLGWFRLSTKLTFFLSGLTNKYPGFSRQINDNFSLDLEYPEKSSRFFAIPLLGGMVRILLLIPFFIYNSVIQHATQMGIFLFSWPLVLIKKRYPETTFELARDQTRLNLSLYVYALGLSDKYPSFRISTHHKVKKLLLIVIALVLFVLPNIASFFFPLAMSLFFKDIPPIDDRDLQLQKVDIPKEQNAFYDLLEIERYIYHPDNISTPLQNHIKGKTWDENFVQETLAKNEKALALFDEAVKKPKFQNPQTVNPAKILSEIASPSVKLNLLASLKLSRVSSLKALSLSRQEKEIEAFNETIKSVEIGQKLQESQVGITDYLLGIAMKERGLETMQEIIAISKLPPEILVQDAKYLEKFKNNKDGLKNAFKGEYMSTVNSINAFASGNPEVFFQQFGPDENAISDKIQGLSKNPFYFRPNKTRSLFANYVRPAITDVGKPCNQIEVKQVKPLFFSSSNSILPFIPKALTGENLIGILLHDIITVTWNFDVYNDKRCQEDFLVSASQLLFILRAYKLETESYPTSLNELVPKYLSKVPEDPFDGKPIRYSPTKKIIYSVGKDAVDSGGSESEDWTQMPDPTFKIEF